MVQSVSPAVRYPLPSGHAGVWLAVTVLGVLAWLLLAWWCQGSRPGVASLVWGMTAWWMAAGCLCWSLRQWPRGELYWSGSAWGLQLSGAQGWRTLSAPQVLLDVQHVLLLRFGNAPRGHVYVLLTCHGSPERWMDLRRAVYLPAYLPPTGPAPGRV